MERLVPTLRTAGPPLAAVVLFAAACAAPAPGEEVPPEERDWLTYAREAELDGSWEVAAHALDQYVRFHPDRIDAELLEHRAALADRAGDPEGGALARARLLKLRPEDDELRIQLADDLQAIGRGAEAVDLLERRIRLTGSPRLREALARIHGRDGRPLEAARLYEKLAEEFDEPQRSALLQTAADFYERGGDLEKALATIERVLGPAAVSAEEKRAIERLQAIGTGRPRNVQDAVDLLEHHPDPEFRLNGIRYLARGSFPQEAEVFRRAAADSDPRIRRIALEELTRRTAAGAVEVLAAAAHDPVEEVRLAALRGLGELGSEAEVPVLLTALDPADRAGFRAARRALERITGQLFGVALDPDEAERERIADQWRSWWRQRQLEGGDG
ncbi:MAG: hypothetical protein D6702_10355 [Planctomycetota bacterium]|nr:MAG: hypothetical protein D6702_10355 [Planctomycetota bacterium]